MRVPLILSGSKKRSAVRMSLGAGATVHRTGLTEAGLPHVNEEEHLALVAAPLPGSTLSLENNSGRL